MANAVCQVQQDSAMSLLFQKVHLIYVTGKKKPDLFGSGFGLCQAWLRGFLIQIIFLLVVNLEKAHILLKSLSISPWWALFRPWFPLRISLACRGT